MSRMIEMPANLDGSLGGDQHHRKHHKAKEHGIFWFVINELDHFIVVCFKLLGLIKFEVKYITNVQLMNTLKNILLLYHTYLFIKFSFLTIVMLLFYIPMSESNPVNYNCSLKNEELIHKTQTKITDSFFIFSFVPVYKSNEQGVDPTIISDEEYQAILSSFKFRNMPYFRTFTYGRSVLDQESSNEVTWRIVRFSANIMHQLGGPFKMGGNFAPQMNSFLAVCMFFIVVAFPYELELTQKHTDVNLSYYRFILGHKNLMDSIYAKRDKQLECLEVFWGSDSKFSLAARDVRNNRGRSLIGRYKAVIEGLESFAHLKGEARDQLKVSHENAAPIKILREIMHSNDSNYEHRRRAALMNCRKFVPFLRGEEWFKMSMVLFTCWVFCNFAWICIMMRYISKNMRTIISGVNERCVKQFGPEVDMLNNWSLYDTVTYYEPAYAVGVMAAATCFFSGSYYGTQLEMHLWIKELRQQIILTKLLALFVDGEILPKEKRPVEERISIDRMLKFYNLKKEQFDGLANNFGGFKSLLFQLNHLFDKTCTQKKILDLSAVSLLKFRHTVAESSLVNLFLFIEEHRKTKHIQETTMERSTLILFGFAIFTSLLQGKSDTSHYVLTELTFYAFIIINFYYVAAASFHSKTIKLMHDIHFLLAALAKTAQFPDVWANYSRIIRNCEQTEFCYRLFGQQITWKRVLILNTAVYGIFSYSYGRT